MTHENIMKNTNLPKALELLPEKRAEFLVQLTAAILAGGSESSIPSIVEMANATLDEIEEWVEDHYSKNLTSSQRRAAWGAKEDEGLETRAVIELPMTTSFPPVSDGNDVLYFDGRFRIREELDPDDPARVCFLLEMRGVGDNMIALEIHDSRACCLRSLADLTDPETGGEEEVGCVTWN